MSEEEASEEAMRQFAQEQAKELLVRPFETWEHQGKLYHAVGLLQMFQRGYTPYEQRFAEPPAIAPALQAWMTANGVRIAEFIVGPPHFEFPSAAVAGEFQRRWHLPGEAQRIGREVAIQAEPPLDFDNLPPVEVQRARHDAQFAKGLAARKAYTQEHGIDE